MARLLLLLTLFLASFAQAATERLELLIHFEKDRSELTPRAQEELAEFLGSIQLEGDFVLTVHGHTDSDGSEDHNETLSLARARTVRDHLIGYGVDPELVHVGQSGERAPLASNAFDSGMARNRRVEITYERHTYADTEELRKALMEGSVQHFSIDPTKDQLVQGAAGTQLKIRANSFMDAHGRPVLGEVGLELTEALGPQSMVAHQLSTRSGNRMLETGGMLKITATDASGAELRIAAASPMEIAIPATGKEEGMELFLSEDGSDWNSTAQPMTTTILTKWVEPPYPTMPNVPFKFPSYSEDQNGRPMKPSEPVLPRPPTEPRHASYRSQKPWWSILFPNKASEAAERRYQAALEEYQKKMVRHEKRVQRFETECGAYAERMMNYLKRKAAWDLQKAAEYDIWQNEVYLPSRARYSALMLPVRAKHDSLVAEWKAVRAASVEQYVLRSDSLGEGEISGLNAYVFTTANMGWINCDRFIDMPQEQKHSIVARGCEVPDAQVFLVFTGIRSMMAMGRNALGEHVSQPVARREPAMVFAYAVIDGQAQVYMEPVGPSGMAHVEFEPSSFAEIGALLKGLGTQPG